MAPGAAPAEKRHLVLSLARPQATLPIARLVLGRIGYAIVSPEEWKQDAELAGRAPALCIVEDRQLGEVPATAATPLLVVCGRGRSQVDDPRVFGVVARPAGLHELYRLFQQALEPIARGCLRAPTNLPVRLRCAGREWQGALLSLSENGCLVRSPEPVELGASLEVAFELPGGVRIETEAEPSYHLKDDTGLVFAGTPASARRAILGYVEALLAA